MPRPSWRPMRRWPNRIEIVEGDITSSTSMPSSMPPIPRWHPAAASAARSTVPPAPSSPRPAPSSAAATTGEAKITPGFRLPARHVIHAVGPVWGGGSAARTSCLQAATATVSAVCREHGLASIAFPAISTGIYGFPPERAARIAVKTVLDVLGEGPGGERVVFCCFGPESRSISRGGLGRRDEREGLSPRPKHAAAPIAHVRMKQSSRSHDNFA